MLLLAHQLGHKVTSEAAAEVFGSPSKQDQLGTFSTRWRTFGGISFALLALIRLGG